MNTNLGLKLFSVWVGLLFLLPLAGLAEEGRKHIAPELLPNSLQLSWQANKPSLGKFGQCAAAFDSKTDDAKMAFACSVYVKLTAVAERKAIQHCDEQRVARQIKAPCQLVR
jgi:hypothetical protein